MTTSQLIATVVAVLLAASRLVTRFRPFWALLPEYLRPWAPAVVVLTGLLAGLLSGNVGAEEAVFEGVVAVVTALGLAAPGLPPQDPPSDGNAPTGVAYSFNEVQTATVASAFAVALAGALAFATPACTPSTVQLGADAVRTTCATCRAIRPVCDTVSPAASGSAQ